MAVGGLDGTSSHTYNMILFALDMLDAVNRLNAEIPKDDEGGNNKFGIREYFSSSSIIFHICCSIFAYFQVLCWC